MWDEVTGRRGGNDIASCVFKHLQSITGETKTVIFYSDSCAGQNKNSYISSMFLTYMANSQTIRTIDHKFLVPGHTHMECDTDHAQIEKKKRKTTIKIHHPHDWYQFVREVSPKFSVMEMEQNDFFDFSHIIKTKFMWRNINENREKFVWRKVKWLRYTKEDYGTIFYKTSLDENAPFEKLNVQRRGINSINIADLPKAYSGTLPISKEKKKLDLLPFIDPCFHDFYKKIKTNEDILNVHPDLADDDNED